MWAGVLDSDLSYQTMLVTDLCCKTYAVVETLMLDASRCA